MPVIRNLTWFKRYQNDQDIDSMKDEDRKINLTYNSSLQRVRVSFTCKVMRQLKEVPPDIYVRMHKKMKSEVQSKVCRKYITYESHLEKIRQLLVSGSSDRWPDELNVHLTIAAGIPVIAGIKFQPSGTQGHFGKLTISMTRTDLQKFHPKTFFLVIQNLIDESGTTAKACEAQLMSVYFKIIAGMEHAEFLLHPAIKQSEEQEILQKGYEILPESGNSELKLVLYRMGIFRKKGMLEHIFKEIEMKTTKMPEGVTIWKNLIKTEVSLALHGIEHFGISMPLSLLAGSSTKKEDQDKQSSQSLPKKYTASPEVKPPQPLSDNENYPGKGLLQLSVSVDKMEAKIVNFNVQYYENLQLNIDSKWLIRELKRHKIKLPDKDGISRAKDNIVRQRDLNGIIVAQGSPSTTPEEPVIMPISEFLELEKATEQKATIRRQENMNLRSMKQAFTMVKKDQLIAKLVFKVPGKEGRDIYGDYLPPVKLKESPALICGGIKSDSMTDFYAEFDGMMKINNLEIQVLHAYHHKGDVNLTSGDISFSGPVYIEGNVDSGASVFSNKDIHITGQIRGGKVHCNKNLRVDKGIITNTNTKLYCGGNISTHFIENSIVECKGNIQAFKAIISSQIDCLGKVEILGVESVCAGSQIRVGQFLLTGDLGYPKGKVTKVLLGENWQMVKSLEISKSRYQHFSRVRKKIKSELQELVRRDKRQLTRKIIEQKTNLQKSNSRLKAIVETLEKKVEELEKNMTYNEDSYIAVEKTCYANCKVVFKDNEISVPSQLQSTVILAKPHHDQHIISLEKFRKSLPKGKK